MKLNRRTVTAFAVVLIKIMLCITLMTGSTWALFTSSTDGDVEIRVSAGGMNVDLLKLNENGEYESIRNTTGNVFENVAWEPGRTELVYFKIENNSTIPIKYIFRFNTDIGELDGALEYYSYSYEGDTLVAPGSLDELRDLSQARPLTRGYSMLLGSEFITLQPGESDYCAVAVRMKPESSNEYQNKSCTIDVNVYAVQGNADTSES